MKRSRTQLILITASLLVVVLAPSYHALLRLVTGYSLAKLKIDMIHYAQTDFIDANKQLQAYGFKPISFSSKGLDCWNSEDSLSTKNYDACTIGNLSASIVTADATFTTRWRQTSPQLEQWFLQHGWHKTWNEKQPISEILDKPHNDGSIGVNYERKHKHVTCTESITWVQPHDPNQLEVQQHCDGSLE